MYLCYKRGNLEKRLPISELLLIYPERGEGPPPGYHIIRRRGVAANLNMVRD